MYKGAGGREKIFFGSIPARLQVDVATFDVFGKELFSRSSANNRQSSQKDPWLVPIEMYRSNVTHRLQSHVTESNQALHRRRRRIFELQPIRGSGRNDSASPTAWRRCLPKPIREALRDCLQANSHECWFRIGSTEEAASVAGCPAG